jgi:hypothetical protein
MCGNEKDTSNFRQSGKKLFITFQRVKISSNTVSQEAVRKT